MREARDTDVWKFTTPREVWRRWNEIAPQLGRRREFWRFLFEFGKRKVCLAKAGLSNLQNDFLREFFGRENRFYLTGGAALVGFYLGHRETNDLDLFTLENEIGERVWNSQRCGAGFGRKRRGDSNRAGFSAAVGQARR
ncbi:MAG: hypothetical protein WKF58_14480 [Ilumatobacteraceae bacterium]